MRTTVIAALAALAALAPATPARADFEGLLVSRMSGEMSGTGRTWVSKAGFPCENVSVTSAHGQEFEMCITSDLMSGSEWLRALQMRSEERGGLFTALREAGVKGFPVRWASKGKDGKGAFAMDLVSAERRSVPASTFTVPAGYI